MGNDWFYEYFINELKAIGRKPTSNMQHEVVDSLPSSGNEQTIYFVKNDSSSSDNHYDEYVWISSSSTFEKIGSSQIDGSAANPDWNQNDATQPDYVKNRPFYTGDTMDTVFVEESTVSFVDTGDGGYMGGLQSTIEATVGETYKVYWDGTAYECTCISVNNTPVIGNLSIVGPDVGSDTGEPFVMGILNGKVIQIMTADTSASHAFSISRITTPVVKIDEKYLPDTVATKSDVEAAQTAANNAVSYASYQQLTDAQKQQARTNIGAGTSSFSGSWNDLTDKPFKPAGESYLTFSSPNSFTLAVKNATKRWDGTLEYFTSDGTWTTWNANSILSAIPYYSEYVLYLRGTGNTIITGNISGSYWVLTGTDIKCIGNIENLLDYATVESGAHPTLADHCYYCLFYGCTSLTRAPALPATTLADHCYDSMFRGCTSLIQAPALPATTLANYCYYYMFHGCTSLTKVPSLPATTLANYCYCYMFYGCTSLTQAPALPATTLADHCYDSMFRGCTSLIQAPALPATTLANYCYSNMFYGCTSLIQAPALPATTLANSCYNNMFQGCTSLIQAPTLPATTLVPGCYSGMFSGCTSLTQAPALPATTLADHCYYYMFHGCTSLTKVPSLPATTLADYCYRNMFSGCASLTQAPVLPATTLANNCYNNMFQGCAGLKLSTTLTNEYTQEYRIPSSGDGTTAPAALSNMFASTGGTFTGAPEINTTYYLSSDNMIARETDIATLNGYVGSMINTAVQTDDHINELINSALSAIGIAEEGAY